jgi:hypothetical protein
MEEAGSFETLITPNKAAEKMFITVRTPNITLLSFNYRYFLHLIIILGFVIRRKEKS